MPRDDREMTLSSRRARFRHAGAVAGIALLASIVGSSADAAVAGGHAPTVAEISAAEWLWPLEGARLDVAFVAPAHRYGAGHRGIDLRAVGTDAVRAPAAGVVAFAGQVAGRSVVTVDHGDGWVTTLEPVESDLAPGTALARGAVVGTLSFGGHAPAGTLHFGVRLHGEYVNPLTLLGGVPRAILLPCC
jgi:murein DD-endopeptidase MepM/ murein hydrolase activator NlpD